MKLIAVIVIVLIIFNITVMPLIFGREREPYGYASWISAVLEACLLIPLCLRVLNII